MILTKRLQILVQGLKCSLYYSSRTPEAKTPSDLSHFYHASLTVFFFLFEIIHSYMCLCVGIQMPGSELTLGVLESRRLSISRTKRTTRRSARPRILFTAPKGGVSAMPEFSPETPTSVTRSSRRPSSRIPWTPSSFRRLGSRLRR